MTLTVRYYCPKCGESSHGCCCPVCGIDEPTLLQALTEGPGSRELSDRVLLSWGWKRRTYDPHEIVGWIGTKGKGIHWGHMRPDPTRNLQHAVDGVPEGWRVSRIWTSAVKSDGVIWFVDLVRGYHNDDNYACVSAKETPTLQIGLCIAIEKARQTDE